MNYIKKISDNEFIINLFIKPNSKNQQILKPLLGDESLTVFLHSLPHKNKANIELLKLLKKKLRGKLEQVHIIIGQKNQFKTIKITTIESEKEENIIKLLVD